MQRLSGLVRIQAQSGEIMKTSKKSLFSSQTRNNFLLDIPMLVAGLVAVLSGLYFIFLPAGGYQGGRNPYYGIVIFFERHTWSDVHTWSSVIIIALAGLHIPLHWSWITKMTRTGMKAIYGKSKLNKFSQFNLFINVLIGLSGLICALSGLYFLFEPILIPQVGDGWAFNRVVWDMIHTWSGVVTTAVAILHFAIHWRWVTKISGKYWNAFRKRVLAFGKESLPEEVKVLVAKG
jgi:hypothetical protein